MSGSPEVQEADVGQFPLSGQQRLWCTQAASAFGPRFVIARSLRVSGHVDTSALRRALDDVAARHEILRTAVVHDAKPPYQRVYPPSPVPLRVRPAPPLAGRSRDDYAQELLAEAEQSSLNVTDLPLLRADLTRFDDRDAVLTLVSHHSAGDAWSMQVIIRDLAACYTARAAGASPALPAVRQFREFVDWERSRATDPLASEDRAYWRGKLRGARFFALPDGRPVAQPRAARYLSHHFAIDADVMTAVAALAKSRRATAFMVALAAIDVLAYQLTGTTDPVILTLTAGRGERQFQDTVGAVMNALPLRTDTRQRTSFRDILDAARDTCLEANSHELPMEVIARESAELTGPGDTGTCAFILGYFRPPSATTEIAMADGAHQITPRERGDQASAQLPGGAVATMNLLPSGKLKCRVEFSPAEVNPDVITGISQDFSRIIARAAADPDRNWKTL
jgi:condensation enzyme